MHEGVCLPDSEGHEIADLLFGEDVIPNVPTHGYFLLPTF
jgi:hypothetical protein